MMTTQTMERRELYEIIDTLPDADFEKLATFVEFLKYAEARKIPNAETIAAIEELRAGKGKKFSSLDELMADLHDQRSATIH